MSEHTLAPWIIDDNPKSDFIDIEPMVCRIERVTTGQDKANARLIAAAPELLGMLIRVMDDYAPRTSYYYGVDIESKRLLSIEAWNLIDRIVPRANAGEMQPTVDHSEERQTTKGNYIREYS